MGLLCYTTKVPARRTIGEIGELLAEHDVDHVMTEYADRQPQAISFTIKTKYGPAGYRLPSNSEGVHRVLLSQYQRGAVERKYTSAEHAYNVAWRIRHEWLKVQLALIEAEMATLDEILMPYMMLAGGETLYRRMIDAGFSLDGPRMLLPGIRRAVGDGYE